MQPAAELAVNNPHFIMPLADIQMARARYQAVKDFIDSILKEGVDFGKIPGSDKPCLFKPGAEKMASFFGFSVRFTLAEKIEDWMGQNFNGEPFFYYRYVCQLWRNGELIAEGEGSCNSWERKYRYRWVDEGQIPAGVDKGSLKTQGGKISEFTFAVDKAETGGKYGKPVEYWQRFQDAIANGTATPTKRRTGKGQMMDAWEIDATLYQLPNPDPADQVNTYQKMAQKRALMAPVLIATNTSDHFTQDIDDYIIDGSVITETGEHKPEAKPAEQVKPPSASIKANDIPPAQAGEKMFKTVSAEAADIFAGLTTLNKYEASKTLQAGFKDVKEVTRAQIEAYARQYLGTGKDEQLPGEGEPPETSNQPEPPAQEPGE